ncbi:hypothetical protein SAMN06264346_11921 [Chryseobacterium profundimaris]|uniref:Lipoprotein n=1 Tax=Chryseobacterium profundimaris TaxID=1387275 RepID=A0ABY1PL96_9FLAO|nr:hypothetical protein SAMN06264346_11921 [Chryseobacterium profundimaris]
MNISFFLLRYINVILTVFSGRPLNYILVTLFIGCKSYLKKLSNPKISRCKYVL